MIDSVCDRGHYRTVWSGCSTVVLQRNLGRNLTQPFFFYFLLTSHWKVSLVFSLNINSSLLDGLLTSRREQELHSFTCSNSDAVSFATCSPDSKRYIYQAFTYRPIFCGRAVRFAGVIAFVTIIASAILPLIGVVYRRGPELAPMRQYNKGRFLAS